MSDDDYQLPLFGGDPLFGGHANTRRGDPQPSYDAAASWTPAKLSETKQRIVTLFQAYGAMTHEELVDAWWRHVQRDGWRPLKEQSIRSRCAELVDLHGLVEDSGVKRKLRDGHDATVWRLVR